MRYPWPAAGPGRATSGRRGLAGYQDNTSSHTPAHQAPQVRRAPERSAAVPVGGGGAWPGFETTRRAKLAARTARGRAAAHRHTQRPGPPAPRTPVGPQATQPHSRALRRPEHQRRPAHQRHNTPRRHNKAARPHRGRAAQPVSEAHRRTTTMSGSPRPLSWRTLEIPSLAATSFAVPSMRGSS